MLARKAQLAAAFNVEDPDHHVSYFDRHRTPVWTPDLLRVATLQPTWVKGLEQLLAQFIESTEKRTTLPAMNTQQRVRAPIIIICVSPLLLAPLEIDD